MTWNRTTYEVDRVDNGISYKATVRGLSNGTFGISYTDGIGFRVTHLPTGWLICRVFFRRLRDAVAFCDTVAPLADWRAMTVESGLAAKADLGPRIAADASRYDHRLVFASGDGVVIRDRKGMAA